MPGAESRSRRKRGRGFTVRGLFGRDRSVRSLDEQRERLVSEAELSRLLTSR